MRVSGTHGQRTPSSECASFVCVYELQGQQQQPASVTFGANLYFACFRPSACGGDGGGSVVYAQPLLGNTISNSDARHNPAPQTQTINCTLLSARSGERDSSRAASDRIGKPASLRSKTVRVTQRQIITHIARRIIAAVANG